MQNISRSYKNPVPDLDDEPQSRAVTITFRFEDPVTRSEAADNINEWFKQNRVTSDMVRLADMIGCRYKQPQSRLGENDTDPYGVGPR